MSDHKLIFSLDIGTRKVAGVVLEPTDNGLSVLAAKMMEHPDRAMLDGQVHKIEAVATIVKAIKDELEKEIGRPLSRAAVAAAGRALLTESYEKSHRFTYPTEVTREKVRSLELEAARAAQSRLQSKEKNYQIHCVGYSAIHYALDGQLIDDLIGHQAREISVKVIATFLPRQVVDSMLTVMRKAGLEASSLTLEPIAAIEATIPFDLRRMNLALVDIGAGTSDIALTRQGSVFAYDMVTMAGDEITEFLCDHLLLEFQEAERLKRLANDATQETIAYQTLLGQQHTITREELMDVLDPVVGRLAQAIGESILKLNEQAPRAIVMVGGGSATPLLVKKLSAFLDIAEQRIGVRGPETITTINNHMDKIRGIEWVTPLGIGLMAGHGQGLSFKKVVVNKKAVQLLALNQNNTVFDALLSAGLETSQLIARPGQAITYTLAGQLKTVPGQLGKGSQLKVNQKAATLDTPINDDDEIVLTKAEPGVDARLMPLQLPKPEGPHWIIVNEERLELELALFDGQELVEMNEPIRDRAELTWQSTKVLSEMIPELAGLARKAEPFLIKVNGKERKISQPNLSIVLEGQEIEANYRPKHGDRIKWRPPQNKEVSLNDLVDKLAPANSITVTVNGKPKTINAGGSRILVNGKESNKNSQVHHRDNIQIETKTTAQPILSHALEGLVPPPKAGPIKIKVDGKEAGFTTPLNDGANIEISFG